MSSSSPSGASLPFSTHRRVFVITGSNTGVGFATAKALALGDDDGERMIILACRTPSKAQAAVEKIEALVGPENIAHDDSSPGTRVIWLQLDLTSPKSIDRFVQEMNERRLPLHVLINNAGVNKAPEMPQHIPFEGMWLSNYLGGTYLTQQLLPLLQSSSTKSNPSRVVHVTSWMHRIGSTNFEEYARHFSASRSYSTSKLAQIFHARALAKRYGERVDTEGNGSVRAVLAHPGACMSDIWNTLEPPILRHLNPLFRLLFLTTDQGAAPVVHAATKDLSNVAPEAVEHFGPYSYPGAQSEWQLGRVFDAWQPSQCSKVTQSKTSSISYDSAIADRLWQLSEKMCKEWTEAANKTETQ